MASHTLGAGGASRKALGTPARIYYKDESVSPAGSHKPNTAVPQAFYNKAEGTARLATETGAGQWGSALCFASALFGLECKVYMVRASYEQKPYRRVLMETWGGNVVPSPVDDPEHPGSLCTAISDAVRDAGSCADTHYSLGSVLNHVLLHHTVIGQEAKAQLALAGEERPDVLPDPDRRALRVRFRRHGRLYPAAPYVHARPRFRPTFHPRRRVAVPRGCADHLGAGALGADGSGGVPPIEDLRSRGHLGTHAGHGASARDRSCGPSGHRRGPRSQRGGQGKGDPFQLLRGTGCSTFPPRTPTSAASWSTERRNDCKLSAAIRGRQTGTVVLQLR